jgi:hypothetical protein
MYAHSSFNKCFVRSQRKLNRGVTAYLPTAHKLSHRLAKEAAVQLTISTGLRFTIEHMRLSRARFYMTTVISSLCLTCKSGSLFV